MKRLRARFQRLPLFAARVPRSAARVPGAAGGGRAARPAHGRGVVPPSGRLRRARLGMLVACVAAGMAGLAARCVHLQVLCASSLLELARSQHEREVPLDPQRGPIHDRNGRELALSLVVDSVFADPSEIGDPSAAARLLSPLLGLKPAALRSQLDSDRHFVWLKRKIDPALRRRIEDLGLRGISFVKESRRFYPKRDLAAHIVGACGVDNQGLAGLEFAFNDRVKGTPGLLQFLRDGRGDRVLDRSRVEPIPGEGIVLTIDETIQHIAEREIDAAMRDSGAEGAAIVVMHPQTGDVLALASRPTFDPNLFAGADDAARRNRAVSDFYEPGSTFKVITAAAALDAGKVRPNDIIFCENGSYTIARHRYHEDRLPFGDLTFTEVLAKSSNIGTIKVAQRMRSADFDEAIRRFGFGRGTALELPGESPGLLRPIGKWSGLSHPSISMGQEIGVTPIQLAAAIGALANDGVYNPPRLIEAFLAPDGRRVPVERPEANGGGMRAVSAQAARTLRRILQSVTTDGTGTAATVPGYTTGGKTGTAQKIDPETRRYSRSRHVAWFAGFVPAETPALAIVVMVDEPKGGRFHGGDVAAPVFSRVALPVLQYLGVTPDRERSLLIDPGRQARNDPRAGGGGTMAAAAVRAPAGRRTAAAAPMNASMTGGLLSAGRGAVPMPDLTGMSLRQATEALAGMGLNCSSQRGGPLVARQAPEPGRPIKAGQRCAVVYE